MNRPLSLLKPKRLTQTRLRKLQKRPQTRRQKKKLWKQPSNQLRHRLPSQQPRRNLKPRALLAINDNDKSRPNSKRESKQRNSCAGECRTGESTTQWARSYVNDDGG